MDNVKSFALDYIEKNPSNINDTIAELIFPDNVFTHDRVVELLKKILTELHYEVPQKNNKSWNLEWSKWRYSKLADIQKKYEDLPLVEAIQNVYEDFGYPVDMRNLIAWFSPKDPEYFLSPEKRVRVIKTRFDNFLDNEKSKIESGAIESLTSLLNE